MFNKMIPTFKNSNSNHIMEMGDAGTNVAGQKHKLLLFEFAYK